MRELRVVSGVLDTMRRLLVCVLFCACAPYGESTPVEAALVENSPRTVALPSLPDVVQEDLGPERPAPASCTGVPVPTLAAHPDLVLDLKPKGQSRVELGRPLEFESAIRNVSTAARHFAVMPGDGSNVGWREPHVWYSGVIDTGDGCWTPLEVRKVMRCGNYDERWQDDVVELGPGDAYAFEGILNPFERLWVPASGRVRLYLHYVYRAGASDRATEPPVDLGDMAGVEPFELVSNPLEFEIQQPLKLNLTVKPHRGRVSRGSQLLDVVLENTSSEARTLATPKGPGVLYFEIEGRWLSVVGKSASEDEVLPAIHLGAGRSVPLLGPSSPNPALEFPWYEIQQKQFRIRAAYQPYGQLDAPPLVSPWVEIDLR